MKITFSGYSKTCSRKLAREAVEFYTSKLISKRLLKTISINIRFITFDKNDDEVAVADWRGSKNVRPKKFVAYINRNSSKNETLKSLAHECVHIKQWATGELIDLNSGNTHFKKVQYYDLQDGDDYWEYPWEIEAYGREIGLFYLFRARRLQLMKIKKKENVRRKHISKTA